MTALGDEVNECARIQQSARDGALLASKPLVERLDPERRAGVRARPADDHVPHGRRAAGRDAEGGARRRRRPGRRRPAARVVTRLAVCGGVYTNPEALAAFAADARARGAERLLASATSAASAPPASGLAAAAPSTASSASPATTTSRSAAATTDCGCGYTDPRDNHFAQLMYDYTRAHTSPDFAAWMATLPGRAARGRSAASTCTWCTARRWRSTSSCGSRSTTPSWRARRVRAAPDVLLCTHTGHPVAARVRRHARRQRRRIGRPANDGRRETLVRDASTWTAGAASVELVPLAYDWRAQAAAMRAAGLPEAFVETVETGWWTTCLEVVPPPRARARALPASTARRCRRLRRRRRGWATRPSRTTTACRSCRCSARELFPPRLWIYTNFHCNLACDYCVVASSPQARKRALGLERFRALVDEAVAEGFEELYVTGGEPFVEPGIVDDARVRRPTACRPSCSPTRCCSRPPPRGAGAARRAATRLVLQTSIDGARPATHDRWRGAGSWERAMDGHRHAHALGLPLRVGDDRDAREPRRGRGAARRCSAALGVSGDDFAVPAARQARLRRRRHRSASDAVMVPASSPSPRTACTGTRSALGIELAPTCSCSRAPTCRSPRASGVMRALPRAAPGRRPSRARTVAPYEGRDHHRLGDLLAAGFEGSGPEPVTTEWGDAFVSRGTFAGVEVLHISRHGEGHVRLSNHVTHLANLAALKQLGATGVLAVTVCGAVDPGVELGSLICFDDLHFLANRLPDGRCARSTRRPATTTAATGSTRTPTRRRCARRCWRARRRRASPMRDGGCYGHVDGPRFNTKAEIRGLAACRRDRGVADRRAGDRAGGRGRAAVRADRLRDRLRQRRPAGADAGRAAARADRREHGDVRARAGRRGAAESTRRRSRPPGSSTASTAPADARRQLADTRAAKRSAQARAVS